MEVVRVLAERGADINKANNDGATPLFIASEKGRAEVVRVLAERGVDINKANNDGESPLRSAQACNQFKIKIIRLLECAHAQQSSKKKKKKNK